MKTIRIVALAATLVVLDMAGAQQVAAVKASAAPHLGQAVAVPAASAQAAVEAEAAVPNKPGEQGIKIHGHWVIDVREPDGKLVKHLDFENSLTTGAAGGTFQGSTGDQLVAALLSGSASPSDPGISFVQAPAPGTSIPAGTDVSGVCSGGSGVPGYTCGIITTARSLTQNYAGYALSVQPGMTATVNFRPAVSWVLAGNFTVPASGMSSITAVQTLLPLCVSNAAFRSSTFDVSLQGSGAGGTETVAANGCTASAQGSSLNFTFGPLTQTTLPGAPVAVAPNQVITVTVTITLS